MKEKLFDVDGVEICVGDTVELVEDREPCGKREGVNVGEKLTVSQCRKSYYPECGLLVHDPELRHGWGDWRVVARAEQPRPVASAVVEVGPGWAAELTTKVEVPHPSTPPATPETFTRFGQERAQRAHEERIATDLSHDRKLPTDAATRKATPVYSGFVKYFPLAMAAVAELSRVGNEQHNPGKPLHWDRAKSKDELDAAARHLLEAGTIDTDGIRHSTKLAWRAMANLEKEIEAAVRERKSINATCEPFTTEAELERLALTVGVVRGR